MAVIYIRRIIEEKASNFEQVSIFDVLFWHDEIYKYVTKSYAPLRFI